MEREDTNVYIFIYIIYTPNLGFGSSYPGREREQERVGLLISFPIELMPWIVKNTVRLANVVFTDKICLGQILC